MRDAAEKPDPPAQEPATDGQPVLTTQAAILIDYETGLTLWEHNAHQRRFPASTSKMMTALLCVEKANLDREVVISERAAATGEATMNLEAGEKLQIRHLLMGLMLNSGNDAAVAIAEAVAGDYDSFIGMMNERAQELGLSGTRFDNPHGLHSEQHYSTAHDLALLGRAVMAVPVLAQMTATAEAVVPWPSKPWDRKLVNRNRLLPVWEAADGIKTGYTKHAGRCLVASATQDGRRLIAVCLDCKDAWADSRTLLEWGFANYARRTVISAGPVPYACPVLKGKQAQVSVRAKDDLVLPVRAGEAPPQPEPQLPDAEAPIAEGQLLGWLQVSHEGVNFAVALVAGQQVHKSLWATIADSGLPAGLMLLLVAFSVGVLVHGAAAKIAGARRHRLAQRRREDDTPRPRVGEWQDGYPAGRKSRSRH